MRELTRLNKFILRNSGLVPHADMADFLGVSSSTLREWMVDLGLPEMETLDKNRAFPIVLRRNHDLLSEEDIARLLRMPIETCRKTAQEMDMLDVKLGERPSDIPGIRHKEEERLASADSFRRRSGKYFNDYDEWRKPFSFLDELSRKEDTRTSFGDSPFSLRMMYSHTATHGDFLLTGEDFYSDSILSRLCNRGVNAGWMPALLRDLAPSSAFKEFGKDHEIRLANLRAQVTKASRYGIKLYLYLNEPRFMPEEFFRKYPESRGMRAHIDGYYGMCTSDTRVRDWLYESSASLFSEVPDLGGVILITASDHETNCYSHASSGSGVMPGYDPFWWQDKRERSCSKCAARGPEQVLGDTANVIAEAAKTRNSSADVIQWLWGWDYIMPVESIKQGMANLNPAVKIMVDWAKYTPVCLFGRESFIDEYTLAHTKPSDYAKTLVKEAKDQGRQVLAKCALVTTAEMNALPYLPVMRNVENLLTELKKHEVDGLLGCWIFGAYPGRNMEMLANTDKEHLARALALKYYDNGANEALEAWELFSSGMEFYPTVQSVLYFSAINPGPGLRFSLQPEPWRHGMVALATEQVEWASGVLGADVMIRCFRKAAGYFEEGLQHLRRAIESSENEKYRAENIRDYGVCEACMRHLLSAANYSEFISVRNRWLENREDAGLSDSLLRVLKAELENSEAMLELAKKDSRIGYEGAIGYFYTPVEIIEKTYQLECDVQSLAV